MSMEQTRERALQYAKLFISLNAGLLGLIAAFVRHPPPFPQLRWLLVLGIVSFVTSLFLYLNIYSTILEFDMWEASGNPRDWNVILSKVNPLLKWADRLFRLGLILLVLFSLVAIFDWTSPSPALPSSTPSV